MDDCPNCGRRLDDGECTRCGFTARATDHVETTEAAKGETTAVKRAPRKTADAASVENAVAPRARRT